MAERAVLRTRSVCVRRLESDGVINVRFSGNCLMNSDGGRGGERWDVDRSSAGISVPDFLYEYFMSQLDEFVWILFVCASLVFVLTWYVILVRSDVPKGRAVLSSAPGQHPCLGPLLHRDPTRPLVLGREPQPGGSGHEAFVYPDNIQGIIRKWVRRGGRQM